MPATELQRRGGSAYNDLMNSYQFESLVYEEAELRVWQATGKRYRGKLIVKEYLCTRHADCLVKEALAQAGKPLPMWLALREVALGGQPTGFTINLLYEKIVQHVPAEILTRSDLKDHSQGLSNYELISLIYQRIDTNVKIFEARVRETDSLVVVKEYGPLYQLARVNTILCEAVVQARAAHPHSINALDIALYEECGSFTVSLVMERMSRDLHTDISGRNAHYTEGEILTFLEHVGAALAHAKSKVTATQGIAHRDIKPANLFLSAEGQYKIGDYGSAWTSSRTLKPVQVGEWRQQELSGEEAGTLRYVSPEMRSVMQDLADAVDSFACDVYSLGVTVIEMAHLEYCRGLNTHEVTQLRAVADGAVAAMEYSHGLKEIVRKMMEVEPGKRILIEEIVNAVAKLRTGQHELESGKSPADEKKLEKLILRLEGGKNDAELADAYCSLAYIKYTKHELKEAEELLRRGVSIQDEAKAPLKIAHSYEVLGIVYTEMEKFEEAIWFTEKTLRIREHFLPAAHPNIFTTRHNLVFALTEMRRYDEALVVGMQTLTQALLTHNQAHIATIYNDLARICTYSGRHEEAIEYGEKALAIAMSLLPGEVSLVYRTYHWTAMVYGGNRQYAKAAELEMKALQLCERVAPDQRIFISSSCSNLSMYYREMKKYAVAAEFAQKSISLDQMLLYEDDMKLARSYFRLAEIQFCLGRPAETVVLAAKSLGIAGASQDHWLLANCHDSMVHAFRDLRKFTEMLEHVKEAITHFSLTGDNTTLLKYYDYIGRQLVKLGKLDAAEALTHEALSVSESLLPGSEFGIAAGYALLGQIFYEKGKFEDAATYGERSLHLRCELLAESDPLIARSYHDLAKYYGVLGKQAEGSRLALKALSLRTESDPGTADTYDLLANLYAEMRRFPEAAEFARKALSISEQLRDDLKTASICRTLSMLDMDMGQFAEAECFARRALLLRTAVLPDSDTAVGQSYALIASVYSRTKRLPEALEYAQKALTIFRGAQKVRDDAMTCRVLVKIYWRMGKMEEAAAVMESSPFRSLPRSMALFAQSCDDLTSTYQRLGRTSEALQLAEESLEIRQNVLPENHIHFSISYHNFAEILADMNRLAEALEFADKSIAIMQLAPTLPSWYKQVCSTRAKIQQRLLSATADFST